MQHMVNVTVEDVHIGIDDPMGSKATRVHLSVCF